MLNSKPPSHVAAIEQAHHLQQKLTQIEATCSALDVTDDTKKAQLRQALQDAQTILQQHLNTLEPSVAARVTAIAAPKLDALVSAAPKSPDTNGSTDKSSVDSAINPIAIKASETPFQQLFETSQDAILLLEDGVFVDCNQAAVTMMRCGDKAVFLALHPGQISPDMQPDGQPSLEKANAMMATALRQGGHRFEWVHRRMDGEDFWVEVQLTPIEINGRQILYTSWRDIGDRKAAENALQETNTLLNSVLETIPGFFFVKDREGRHVVINSNLADFFGKPIHDVIGKTDAELMPADVAAAIMLKDQEIMMQGITQRFEEIVPKKGVDHTYLTIKVPFRDAQGRIVGMLGLAQDISDRKAAEAELYQHQQLLRSTYEGVENSIVIIDVSPDGEFLFSGWNPAAEKHTGVASDHVFGKTPEDALGLEKGAAVRQNYQRCLNLGISITYEECLAFQGREKWWFTTLTPLRDAQGRIYRIVLTTFEITERKAAENALQETNTLLNSVLETIPGFFCAKDREGRHVVVNSNLANFFNKPIHEIIGKTDADLFAEDKAVTIMLEDQEVMTQGTSQHFEALVPMEGVDHTYLIAKTPLYNTDDKVVGVIGLAQDISDRKEMEVSLRYSEQRFRDVTEAAGEYIWEMTPDGIYTFITERAKAVKGYSPSELLGRTPFEFMPEADIARVESIVQAAAAKKSAFSLEHRDVLPSGKNVWEAVSGVPIFDNQGELIGFRGTGLSITERKAAETALAESEAKFRRLVEDAADLIYTIAADGTFMYLSPQFTQMSGYEVDEFLHEPFALLVHPDDLAEVMASNQRLLTTGKKQAGLELRLKHRNGTWVWVTCNNSPIKDATGQVVGLQGIARDVSDRKATEAALKQKAQELEQTLDELQRAHLQMIQSEKLSSLGQLVAGVAHEINNPVSFIYSNIPPANRYTEDLLNLIHLYQTHYPKPPEDIRAEIEAIDLEFLTHDLPKILASMKIGAERIREIIGSLRTFSRLNEADYKAVDIHAGLDSTLVILKHRLKATSGRPAIQIIKDYGDLGLVECYAGQLNQVFMNILANAVDALEDRDRQRPYQEIERSPSQITIRTKPIGADRVSIHILDNGPGIPDTVRQNIFDPFFTTKPVGKGTGMGMSISHQIITENHGGTLQCFSVPGQETEFVIEIPRHQRLDQIN
ncbi:MAG: PAS domain S-box protein [Cyanobacteria bacterium J06638_22]